jgi:hypothetical protein
MTVQKQIPDLGGLLDETSQALVRLDVGRLEEIALSCEDLMRDWRSESPNVLSAPSIDRGNAGRGMGAFKRLLELTNANRTFMRGLVSMRGKRLEYGRIAVNTNPRAEVEYGND